MDLNFIATTVVAVLFFTAGYILGLAHREKP